MRVYRILKSISQIVRIEFEFSAQRPFFCINLHSIKLNLLQRSDGNSRIWMQWSKNGLSNPPRLFFVCCIICEFLLQKWVFQGLLPFSFFLPYGALFVNSDIHTSLFTVSRRGRYKKFIFFILQSFCVSFCLLYFRHSCELFMLNSARMSTQGCYTPLHSLPIVKTKCLEKWCIMNAICTRKYVLSVWEVKSCVDSLLDSLTDF